MWQVLKDILKLEFIVVLKNSRWAKCCGIVCCIPIEVHSQHNKHLLSMLPTQGTKGPIAMLIAFTFQCLLNAHTKHVLLLTTCWVPCDLENSDILQPQTFIFQICLVSNGSCCLPAEWLTPSVPQLSPFTTWLTVKWLTSHGGWEDFTSELACSWLGLSTQFTLSMIISTAG